MKAKTLIVVLCAAAAGLLCQARAGVVLSNLDQPWDANQPVHAGDWFGDSFTTGPGPGMWILESVRQRMWIESSEWWGVDLYQGTIDSIGPYIGRLNQQEPGGQSGDFHPYLFGSTESYLLQPNSTYWLITKPLQATVGNALWVNSPIYQVQESGWSFGPVSLFSDDGGLNWSPFSKVQRTELSVQLVPEPQTMAMLAGLGLLGFALLRRRLA